MKKLFFAALACAAALVPDTAQADVNDTMIVRVRALQSYLELRTSTEACPGAGLGDWSFRPRVDYSSGAFAEGVRQLALGAMLSGKKVDIGTSVSGGRCYITDFLVEG